MSLLADQFGRPDLARNWAGKARALEPDEIHHLFGEGVALQQIGRLAEAEARYRRSPRAALPTRSRPTTIWA